MDIGTLLRGQFQQAHGALEGTMAGVTNEQTHWSPPGKAHPIGANYAHVVIEEDALVNGLLRGDAPLFARSWAGRTGVSEILPLPSPDAAGIPPWDEWARRVQVDLEQLKQYAQAVYASTDEYLASLSPEALSAPMDLSRFGLGQQTLAWFIANIIIANATWHTGEISCLKGLQGVQGYPF